MKNENLKNPESKKKEKDMIRSVQNGNNMLTRGFITIATGNEKYFILANNLLKSYRAVAEKPLPFAILTDRENEYTSDFDDVILFQNKPNNSYLDKLYLSEYIPYNETVFIDADSLCVSDPVGVFDDFNDCGDFSFYGRIIPLDSKGGWFDYSRCGEYKERIKFNISGHGGLYYLRRTEQCREIMNMAIFFAENYERYGFNYFEKPADEPVVALAMAVAGCPPCQKERKILFWPGYRNQLKIDVQGNMVVRGKSVNFVILHFGMHNTQLFTYQWLYQLISNDYYKNNHILAQKKYVYLKLRLLMIDIKKKITHKGVLLMKKILANANDSN